MYACHSATSWNSLLLQKPCNLCVFIYLLITMSERQELTEFERGVIIGGWLFGHSEREIEEKTDHPKTTIHDTIERYRETGTVTPPPRTGRPRILSDRDKRHLERIVRSNRKQTTRQVHNNFVESSGTAVSISTIKRALYDAGYNSRVAARKPYISLKNQSDRLKWCRERRNWEEDDWKTVIWSDESRFTLFKNDGRTRVWRLQKERYDIDCIVPTVKHGGGGVMVWGCFTWDDLGPLIQLEGTLNSHRYIEEVLKPHLVPFMEKFGEDMDEYEFQQDNATIHTSKMTREYFEKEEINVMKWPGQSPDLNPIEHLWDELERRIRKREPPPKNERELAAFLRDEWEKIPTSTYQNLILSMNNRVKAVLEAKGYATSY